MAKLELAFFDLGTLDTLAYSDSPVHRLDPRVKVVVVLTFILTVASYGRYEVTSMLPLALFPWLLISLGGLPLGYLARKVLLVAPFALFIGIFNPLLDQTPYLSIGDLEISGGWLSFASILLRFVLTVSSALILIATTSFPGVCRALERLGAPRVFAVQLLFLYRYLFVLVEEGARMVRARKLRSQPGRGEGFRSLIPLLGQLLLRTLARAQRIHQAMLCRAFDGEFRSTHREHFGRQETLFLCGWCGFFLLARLYPLPQLFGKLFLELIP
ncbi:MAG: cobalt ECF transporter T component CbiQ [Desulfuromonas sp.]|nr:MAG: cobalt ECF transporter T component CbiQ [Desulfuromonas sp.]